MSWIRFNGVRSDTLGAVIVKMPSHVRAARRMQRYAPPARHGILHIPDGSYEPITLEAVLNLFGKATINTMDTWLDGSGDMITSDDPNRCYRATIYDDIQYQRLRTPSGKPYDQMTVRFECHPFRYEASPVTLAISAAGQIVNPGTVESEPVLTVTGSGSGTITIGEITVQLEGITDSVVIDCEARKVYSEAAGAVMTGDFPLIPVGTCAVGFTGGVTGLSIQPNWRWK